MLFERTAFTAKTKLKIAYLNFFVNRSFPNYEVIVRRLTKASLAPLAIFAILSLAFNYDFLVPESKASITQEIEAAQMATVETVPTTGSLAAVEKDSTGSLAVVIDKYSKTLYLLREESNYFTVIKRYKIALGEMVGSKALEGDLKTPEGHYKVIRVKEKAELDRIYGPKALVLNYPNEFDRQNGYTGGGIWIHGSGLGKRTPDTKGCIELDDKNIIELSQLIDKDTIVAIYPIAFPLPVVNDRVEKDFLSKKFFYNTLMPQFAG